MLFHLVFTNHGGVQLTIRKVQYERAACYIFLIILFPVR